MKDIKSLLKNYNTNDKFKYVTREFQDYGYRIAAELNDLKHKSLYIKLAKETDRNMMEEAFAFAKHYNGAKNKGRIFMWKLKELKNEQKDRQEKIDKELKKAQRKLFH